MKLNLIPSEDGITRLASEGDITLLEVQGCANPLQGVLGPDGFRRKVLLSLERSCFVDSAGVGWLILAHKKFSDAGGLLVVHSLPPLVNHSFRLLQVGSILHLADDEAAALQVVRGMTTAQPAAASSPAECD
jgi:anti-anti-sigma regulatory factor